MDSNKDPFADMQEVKAAWVKFSKIGDFVKGTLVDKRQIKSNLPGKEGQLTWVYELRAHVGQFHNTNTETDALGNKKISLIEPPVTIGANEFWMIGGKESIDNAMRNSKKGQIVAFRLDSIKPSKTPGFAPQKVIKVLVGAMDPEYMGETSSDTQA